MLKRKKMGDYEFFEVELIFEKDIHKNVFALKNNKSLLETIKNSEKYLSLKGFIKEYSTELEKKLGNFLLDLKNREDENYKKFLNKYGDVEYSTFKIKNIEFTSKRGIYLYMVDDEIKYIGRCLDNFGNRINQGYGKIHPKNCFKDGQATNCRLNSLITKYKDNISLWVYVLDDDCKIKDLEDKLILKHNPVWNEKKPNKKF